VILKNSSALQSVLSFFINTHSTQFTLKHKLFHVRTVVFFRHVHTPAEHILKLLHVHTPAEHILKLLHVYTPAEHILKLLHVHTPAEHILKLLHVCPFV